MARLKLHLGIDQKRPATVALENEVFFLEDLGGFGAEPDALWPLLLDSGVEYMTGNYDVAIGNAADDCGCGYRDPTDIELATIAYDFTRTHTRPRSGCG